MKIATYGELVKHRQETGYCPFCAEGESNYIDSNDTAYVIVSRAPYESDHILICPKIHRNSMTELDPRELADIRSLITKRNHILYNKHADLVIFIREGSVSGKTGKTVGHLHRHIVPHMTIHYNGTKEKSDAREFMSDELYQKKISHLQSYF